MKNVEDKLDKISDRLDEIVKVQIEQAADLKHHIYRSDLNEENIELLRSEVKPIIKAHEQFSGAMRLAGIICTGTGVIVGVIKGLEIVLKFFR